MCLTRSYPFLAFIDGATFGSWASNTWAGYQQNIRIFTEVLTKDDGTHENFGSISALRFPNHSGTKGVAGSFCRRCSTDTIYGAIEPESKLYSIIFKMTVSD